jgi:cytochrome c biogenesis protein
VKAVYRFFKSVRLAVILILVIIVLSLLATLVPQGRPDAWYQASYSPALYAAIRLLRLGSFFRSYVFLVPVIFFTLNLGTCAVDRIVTRTRTGAKHRHGPDLIHIGLLVLIAGGLVTALGRQEKTWTLAEGEEAIISPSYSLRLLSFQTVTYDNGSPKEWISTVSVTHGGRQEIAAFPIRVNRPLRLKGITVYQSSWDISGTLLLTDQDGNNVAPPSPGDYFEQGDSRWVFTGFQKAGGAWAVVFKQYRGMDLVAERKLCKGDSIGPFTVKGISAKEITGLKAVRDPGLPLFLAALLLVTAGLCLAFIQKRGDATS